MVGCVGRACPASGRGHQGGYGGRAGMAVAGERDWRRRRPQDASEREKRRVGGGCLGSVREVNKWPNPITKKES